MNNFYVGQKVVCFSVNPSPYPCHHIEVSKLQINKIYTIREIIKFSDRYSLRLVEIVNMNQDILLMDLVKRHIKLLDLNHWLKKRLIFLSLQKFSIIQPRNWSNENMWYWFSNQLHWKIVQYWYWHILAILWCMKAGKLFFKKKFDVNYTDKVELFK